MTWLARITFVVLAAATVSALFVAQRLKSAPPVIKVRTTPRLFSPNGDGVRDRTDVLVTLKASDDVSVDVVDAAGDTVKRLAAGVRARPHIPLRLEWRGDTDAGGRAPDGRYRVRVALRSEGRSVVVPHSMTLDTQPPRPVVRRILPGNIVGPAAGPVQILVRHVSSRWPTRFDVLRTDVPKPRVVARFTSPPGAHRATWDGKVDGAPAPDGLYLFRVSVRDRAGNVGVTPSAIEPGAVPGRPGLTVRGIAAQPPLRPVVAGRRAEFRVDARRRSFRWRVRRIGDPRALERGSAPPDTTRLVVRAPRGPSGAYLLELRSGRSHAAVPFLVQGERRASVLVVVPAITWVGGDRVDDAPFDGVPDSLYDGAVVRWPRILQGVAGLPAGFATDVAPLLVFLDRARIRYDLTSDIDLALSGNPRASDRPGVLLDGSETWIPRTLARRLRQYVADGGRLASFGVESLRRGVLLRANAAGSAGLLAQPTQPTALDPFGARLGALRAVPRPTTLSVLDEQPGFKLFEGTTGQLAGFTRFEESAPVAGHATLLAGLGQDVSDAERAAAEQSGKPAREPRPALTAVRLGKGLVIRVGLPEWTQHLRRPDVAQVTRNIVDLLRGVTPKVRSTR